MTAPLRFDGRVALISGAGRGLGRAYALHLAERGAKVVVNNRTGTIAGDDPASDVVAAVKAAGGDAIVHHGSVEAEGFGEAMVEVALAEFGRIDIVVANAGAVLEPHDFLETSIESFEHMFGIHFRGTYGMLKAAWPHLLAQEYGRVVVTGSASGLYGQPRGIEYSAAKGAITGLFRALAAETEGTGIRLNLIAPGGTTSATERLDFDDETMAFLRSHLDPALVAPVLAALVHDSCPFNGRMISAGGGHAGRVMIGEDKGIWNFASDGAAFLDVAGEMDRYDDLVFHEDAISWGSWLAAMALEKRAGAGGIEKPAVEEKEEEVK